MTATATLKADIFTTSIHGITGRPIAEGTVAAGSLVRNVRQHGVDSLGETLYRFEASDDQGLSWYTQESYDRPKTK